MSSATVLRLAFALANQAAFWTPAAALEAPARSPTLLSVAAAQQGLWPGAPASGPLGWRPIVLAGPSATPVPATNGLVGFGATWKYLDDGSDQGTGWREPAFADQAWPSGPAELGYGDGDEDTVVGFGPDPRRRFITTYFRHAFVVTNAARYTALGLRLRRDDGGVVYLNGAEAYRSPSMPGGEITSTTLASDLGENTLDTASLGVELLRAGTNLVAVEVHQQSVTSSDISFDLELTGTFLNSPPLVTLVDPAPDATFTAPLTLPLSAAVTDPDGEVRLVEFFVNGTQVGQANAAPFQTLWPDITIGGPYTLHAVATDNDGARGTSDVVHITILGNLLPTVRMTAPPDDAVYLVPTNLTFMAEATDPDGAVARVEFRANGAALGSDPESPYAFAWTNDVPGRFTLVAVALDDVGAAATSAPVAITFQSPPPPGLLVSTGSVWKYYDTVTAEVPGWTEPDFDDGEWPSGPAELGYGDAPGRPEATVVGYGPDEDDKHLATYFRHRFLLPDPSIYKSLTVRLLRDDGAVVYLNGREALRSNMPAEPVTYDTRASGNADDDGAGFATITGLPADLLRSGPNVVAVEIHQVNQTSTDISFDFELTGRLTNAPPQVAIASPGDGLTFTEPATLSIQASAHDPDGMVTNVQFYVGEVLLGEDAAEPFAVPWADVTQGAFLLSAVAWDNLGTAATSRVVQVFVVPSTAPTVAAFIPASGIVSELTEVTVRFSEPVAGIDAADLLVNGIPATEIVGSGAVYTFSFPRPLEGPVTVAWDVRHGITDREQPPQPFRGTGTGETARYELADDRRPSVAEIRPAPGATVRALTEIEVTFSEPVGGVRPDDFRMNGHPASAVSGSLAGPYRFQFAPLLTAGPVEVAWSTTQTIHDFARASNSFAGASWSYTIAPQSERLGVVINEIMYHPASQDARAEFLELLNLGETTVNLTGWQFSDGVAFTFPSVTLPAGQFLVVAADPEVFRDLYPEVANVTGGWSGQLSNRGEGVTLRDALGAVVDRVHYATEGDWAVRQRGPLDNGARGWEWFAPHDGLAVDTATGQTLGDRSLELVSPTLPNEVGQNWAPSRTPLGTPGRPNSAFTTNAPPLIDEVAHVPPVPRSTDAVAVTARIADEQPGSATVSLEYRDASTNSPLPFLTVPMADDGQHRDGAADDGVYGAWLPALPAGTVVEYYVAAADEAGNARTWPAAVRLEDGTWAQVANALYQVEDQVEAGTMPVYRLVLTETERLEFRDINRNSDAEMNATFISSDGVDTKVRHNVGVRIRGAGTRSRTPPNLRVNIPSDRTWNGLTELNLNTQYTHAQVAGSALSLKAGLPCAQARPVQVRLNSANPANAELPQFGCYVFVEPINGEWAERHFPDDPDGNVYRASRFPWTANLDYRGSDPATYASEGYAKTSNQSEDDWSDLIQLTYALSPAIPDVAYAVTVAQQANLELFLRYFAVCNALDYRETGLCRGVGDDYAMYRGEKDPRFLLIPHDFDTILGEGDTAGDPNRSIWVMLQPPTTDPAQRANFLERFLRAPELAPLYYRELLRLTETAYSAAEFNPLLDQVLGGWVPLEVIQRIKDFAAARNASIRSQIPLTLTVVHSLPTRGGYLYTTNPVVTLSGQADALSTRSVRVGQAEAEWSAFAASWTNNVMLEPGIHRVLIQALGDQEAELERLTLDVWYDTPNPTLVTEDVTQDTTWLASGGPYVLPPSLSIRPGATLSIGPGTTLYLAPDATLTINGRLLAEGTDAQPIRLTRAPDTTGSWRGLRFVNAAGISRLVHVEMAYGGNDGEANVYAAGSTLFLDHVSWTNTTSQLLDLNDSSITLLNSVLPSIEGDELIHFAGFPAGGHALIQSNHFGTTSGYNDIIDFTGGNRPGPIVRFRDNVFTGGVDDVLDLDGTDAHIEGNVFLNVHQDALRDSAAHAISTGRDSGETAELVIARNIFYDCDHAVLLKEGASAVLQNNTVVRIATNAPSVALASVVNFGEPNRGVTGGLGAALDGNILWHLDQNRLYLNFTNTLMSWSVDHSIVPGTNHPGSGNLNLDPLFVNDPGFSVVTEATIKSDLSLQAASPARGTGPNGLDMGALVPGGATITGEPASPTPLTTATLHVGGPGLAQYRYRLDDGPWSEPTGLSNTIILHGLAEGGHVVAVSGLDSAGFEQATPTVSRTWFVNRNAPGLRLNEVLARNDSSVPVGGRFPDLVELYNAGATALDLGGASLTDTPDEPRKFSFPSGTVLGAGEYLVLYADSENVPDGFHLGFALRQEGEAVYLFAADGRLLDAVTFGLQVADFSIGRLADGRWALTQPTFGTANVPARTADPSRLRINEWLATSASPLPADFVELYNPEPFPVALSGLPLTDTPQSLQNLHPIADLSFIGSGAFALFLADGNPQAGAEHLGFRLTAEQGRVGLYGPDLTLLDWVSYGSQTRNVSEGRSPNGTGQFTRFTTPTPGTPNPAPPAPDGTQLVINEVLARNGTGLTNAAGGTPEWIELYNPTAEAIDLGGLSLSDDPAAPRKYVFLPGTRLASLAYGVWLCDDSAPADAANTGFGLAGNGGAVYLYGLPERGGALLGSITFGVQARDFSIGRVPDGGTNWGLNLPTPGGVNLAAALGDPAQLRLNEWMADPASGSDWFELYNPNPQPAALGGLYLTDDLRTPETRRKFRIAPLSFIGTRSYGYERFFADDDAAAGPNHVNFALRGAGESIGLHTADDLRIDAVTFQLQTEGVSEGRLPDGAPNIVRFPGASTPAAPNRLETTDQDGDGLPDAWEIANGFDPRNPLDAAQDADGDSMSNLDEYQYGTDPRDAASVLRLEIAYEITSGRPAVVLRFDGVAGRSYTIEAAGAFPADWTPFIEFPRVTASGPIWSTNEIPAEIGQQFFRLPIIRP